MALTSTELQQRLNDLETQLLNKPNRTAEEDEILKAVQEKDMTSGGLFGQIIQGLQYIGLPAEEVTALTVPKNRTSMLSEALKGQNLLPESDMVGFKEPSNYDLALALQRGDIKEYAKNNPVKSFVGKTAGSIIPLIAATRINPNAGGPALIKQTGNLARALMNPQSIKQAGGGAAVMASGGGFLEGEDSFTERAKTIPLSAITGGVLGGAGKVLTDLGGSLIQKYILPKNPKKLGIKQAREMINQALKDEGLTPALAIEKLMKNVDSEFSLADLGNNPTQLLSVINTLPGTGSKKAGDFLRARNEGKINRLYHIFDKVKNGNWIDEYQALQGSMKKKGDRFYNVAFKGKNSMIDLNKTMLIGEEMINLNTFFNRPSFAKAFESAKNIAKEKGENFGGFTLKQMDNTGNVFKILDSKGRVVNKLPTRILQRIKVGYDDLIYKGKGADRALGKEELASIIDTKNKFLQLVDSQNPAFKRAREEWAGDIAILDAMNLGKNIKSNKFEYSELAEMVKKFNKSEKEAFRIGAMNSFINLIESKGTNSNIARNIANSTRDKNLLRLAWGGTDESFNNFWTKLTNEMTTAQTSQTVLGNSATAVRLNFNKKIAEAGDDYKVNVSLTQLVGEALNKEAKDLDAKRLASLNKEISRILTTTAKDGNELQIIKKQLDQGATLKEMAAMYPELLEEILKLPLRPASAAVASDVDDNTIGALTGGKIRGPIRAYTSPLLY